MDDYKTTSSFDSFELQFTPVAQGFLRETAKWAKFISIVGFIGLAIYLIMGLFMIAGSSAIEATGAFGDTSAATRMSPTTMGIIYIIVSIIYFFPVLYLNRFATKAQQALNNNQTESLTQSFENLKSHYKFLGILLIITLIFILLGMLLVMIGVGAAAAMS